ncbi:MAG: phosphoglycerate kinase [Candidatus Methanomethylophilaceae archaeon]|nr:phosphoglycerate kinase [Candidatus Methanomethylophilaceae archaeon]MBQ8644176.1 phosphoglycerate kinase [Candidatus Methanomethylophilaceae archaeon]MBR2348224.1 phosphoglycerate kinase [Candidatus Methanomethylophilaceae archaeon]MBR2394898.1 phosphoglycerate kinase [Candidatus Methanomethylophilaceae archaeon]
MVKDFNTLEDFDYRDKTVLLRVDINCPLDKKELKIVNDSRIRRIVPTVRELMGKRAKVVILAHQSRKGGWDFINLEQHAEHLSRHLNSPVKYVDDVLGEKASEAIRTLNSGELLLLGNVREIDSETAKVDMFAHAEGEIVEKLSPMIDYYVCDAFGASHRSQCSLVGFPVKVPSASGRLMAKEMFALKAIFENPRRPSVFILGGAKFGDVSEMIDRVLGNGVADTVILVGLAGNAYLLARGVDIGEASSKILSDELTPENLQAAKDILAKYGQKVLLPVDVAVERDGKRVSVNIGDLPTAEPALDIGDDSAEKFRKVIQSSKTCFMSGPAGMIEKDGFEIGTRIIMTAMVDSGGQSVIGGGHTGGAAERFDLADRFSYVSTGGGALETFLLGEPLPVIEALKYSREKFSKE